MISIGTKAPDVLGVDAKGNEIKLSNYQGRKLVLYFYPKDSTPGAKSHQRFAEKNVLPFPLISDTDKTLVEAFGVWGEKKMAGRTYMGIYRTTFIINEEGIVERIIGPKEIKVKEHAGQILS